MKSTEVDIRELMPPRHFMLECEKMNSMRDEQAKHCMRCKNRGTNILTDPHTGEKYKCDHMSTFCIDCGAFDYDEHDCPTYPDEP